MSHNQRKLKQSIIEILRDAPFINHAVKKVGIARTTFYRWMRNDKIFEFNVNAALQEGHKCMIELAESALFKKIREGHFGGIKFYLENNHGNYMNRKYRIETLPKRNYDDSPAYAHARMPNIVAFSEEEMEYIEDIKSAIRDGEILPEEVEDLIEMVRNGKFSEIINERNKKQDSENA
jgi:hypothetical protein